MLWFVCIGTRVTPCIRVSEQRRVLYALSVYLLEVLLVARVGEIEFVVEAREDDFVRFLSSADIFCIQ